MAITVVGLLEADLPGAIEYKEGGVGPLFRESRTEEPISLYEFLERSIGALKKLRITDVVSCFIDDIELLREDASDGESGFDVILREARTVTADGGGIVFHLMLAYHDKQLSHVITVEASVDHPSDEAALSILDTARLDEDFEGALDLPEEGTAPLENDDDAEGGWGFESDQRDEESSPLAPVNDDITFLDERAADAEDLVEDFLEKVLAQFERELGVSEPEIDVWTDWEGAFDAGVHIADTVPGTGV